MSWWKRFLSQDPVEGGAGAEPPPPPRADQVFTEAPRAAAPESSRSEHSESAAEASGTRTSLANGDPPSLPPPPSDDDSSRDGWHPEDVRMTLGEHLEELRWRVVKGLVALVLACLLCIWPAKYLLELIARPAIVALKQHNQPTDFLATSPVEAILIYIKVVVITGVIIAAPYVLNQLWGFVAAGLYPRERRYVTGLIPWSVGLFLTGVAFMYIFVLAISLNFLVGFNNWLPLPSAEPTGYEQLVMGAKTPKAPESQPALDQTGTIAIFSADPENAPIGKQWINVTQRRWKIRTPDGVLSRELDRDGERGLITTHFKIGDYLTFFLLMTIAFGLAFQMPLVVMLLAGTGIVPVQVMRNYRKVVILVIVMVAGILAPPDLLSHMMLSGPMIGLFELGLFFAARSEKRRAAERAAS